MSLRRRFKTDTDLDVAAAEKGFDVDEQGRSVKVVATEKKRKPSLQDRRVELTNEQRTLRTLQAQADVSQQTLAHMGRQLESHQQHFVELQDALRAMLSVPQRPTPKGVRLNSVSRDDQDRIESAYMEIVY